MGQISGFSTASSGFRSKGASLTDRRAFNAGSGGGLPAAAISGQLSAADASLQSTGASQSILTAEGSNTVHLGGHRTGATSTSGFPDSTRMAIPASPIDPGSFSLFGFSTSVAAGFPDMDNTTFLHPTPYSRRSLKQEVSSLSTTARVAAVWKEYELGITPGHKLAGNTLHTGLTTEDPIQRFKQQQRYATEFGVYGANMIERLKDMGLTGNGLDDQGLSH